MEKMRAHPEVMVRINMDPRPITPGNLKAVEKEVDRVLELANNRDKVPRTYLVRLSGFFYARE